MPEFTTVCKTKDISPGKGAAFPVNGTIVAVFNDGGEFHAINDFCPHMGASLADGHLEDGEVTCPWHAWRFCVRDGSWCDNPRIRTDAYELRVVGDEIQVAVPEKTKPNQDQSSESGSDSV